MMLEIAKKKDDQIDIAVECTQSIADRINKKMMLKMARRNCDAMLKTLQGYLV